MAARSPWIARFSPWYGALAVASGLGLLGKVSLIAKFTHLPMMVVTPIALLFPCLPLLWPIALRARMILGPLALLGLIAFSLFVYPRMDAVHKLGRGSDQAECVVLAGNRLATYQWPYVSSMMSSHNPMSCGPGWVALQAPIIHTVGYRWDLALIWIVCAAALVVNLGWDRTSGIFALTGLSGGVWMSAANGCDFTTFGIALAALATLADSPRIQLRWAAAILFGFVGQFRAVTAPIPVFFARQFGWAGTLFAWAFATLFQMAFLLWNPSAFVNQGPLHIAQKLLRTSVLSNSPAAAAAEFLFISLCGLAIALAISRYTEQPLLLYLSLAFVLPAVQNLIIRYRQFGDILLAFEFWEGGVWIAACVPLAAMILVVASTKTRLAATQKEVLCQSPSYS